MSEVSPEPLTLEQEVARNQALQAELNDLKAKLAGAKAPSRASVAALATKSGIKKFLASIAAALTTPDAIKAEKSLAVIALTRAVILLPSLAVAIDVLIKLLGGPAVGNP